MKLARYLGGGVVGIVDEPEPALPEGGLLIQTEACGLCSGELMDWYMERKIPHVLGHEVAGRVIASDDDRFPVGCRVFPHHHAPCLECDFCRRGLTVHCPQWRATKLLPGGMAERFAVPAGNLNDTVRVDDLRPVDAALIEPLACVEKAIRLAERSSDIKTAKLAVIGLGVMGLMHMLRLPGAVGYDLNPSRIEWARGLGLDARHPDQAEKADVVFVCPGTKAAFDFAASLLHPGGTLVLFAPMEPGSETPIDLHRLYFLDATIVSSYSCGPEDTLRAREAIQAGTVRAEQVVSDFVGIDGLPAAYERMKRGEILKAMVVF